jgi:hypothetical protein
MAFVQSQIPEEQQNQFAQQGQTTPNPLALVPPQAGGSAGQGGGSQTTAPGVGSSTQFGSGASRLGDYLKANQDQVQGMASDIAGDFSNQYSDVQNQITQAGQQFGNQVSQGYTPNDPSLLQQVQDNPVQSANDPQTLEKFRKQMQSTYSGPSSFEASDPYMNVQKNVQDAMSQADLVKNFSGLSTYLQQNVSPTATPGQNTLDTTLLQANQPAFNSIKQAVEPFSGLDDYLAQISGQQTQAIQQAQQGAPQAAQAAQSTYQGLVNPFVSGLNESYQGATKQATDYNTLLNSISDKIGNNDLSALTPEEQQLIGFNPQIIPLIQQYGSIFPTQAQQNPLTPSQFLTQGAQAQVPGPQNVVNQDQIAMWQALSQLGGGAPQGLNFEMPTEAVGIPGQGSGLPGQLPAYNNMGVLNQIQGSYGNMYDQLKNTGFAGTENGQEIINYMNQLYSTMGQGQPTSQPTSPPPAPGTGGDLGMGFHWDEGSGTWMPTIPMQPINPGGGGGRRSGEGGVFYSPGVPS